MKIAAIIPARANSKRCPDKNTKPFYNGESLLWWTIAQANASRIFAKILVTTDLSEFKTPRPVIKIKRPHFLANDSAKTEDAVLHALWSLDDLPDAFFLLQATSPFRKLIDYQSILKMLTNVPGVLSYQHAGMSRNSIERNGAFYAWNMGAFLSIRNLKATTHSKYMMPPISVPYIDETSQFEEAQRLMLTEEWSKEYKLYL